MELAYHYLWKYKIFGRPIATTSGDPVEIISPGVHNNDSGPDFTNAKVRIAGQLWAGNVEIHVKASDWYRHGHQNDPAYDNIILHVVAVSDCAIHRPDGSPVPQVEVAIPERFLYTYAALANDLKGVKCGPKIREIPRLIQEDWLESLAIERLHFKASRILGYFNSLNADWEQTMFTVTARALGFGLNGLPFELLAKSLPLKYIYHHADNLLQVEALLFGQAGMLDPSSNIFDEYYQSLCTEYLFMARKYGLRPMKPGLWKYTRTRPGNFPHRRIALLASALHKGFRFTDTLRGAAGDIETLLSAFRWRAEGYWQQHGAFGEEGKISLPYPPTLSRASRESLLINVAAPFYYAYGRSIGDYDLAEYGANILASLSAEKNSIISRWAALGLEASDALRTQALIHLKNEYCDSSKCLRCRFGHYFLRIGAGGRLFNHGIYSMRKGDAKAARAGS